MNEKHGFTFSLAMLVPIAGWVYIVIGIIWPFEHWVLVGIWWIDVFLSVVVHGIQLFVALPVGSHHGFSKLESTFHTFVFGATWWRPLQVAMRDDRDKESD